MFCLRNCDRDLITSAFVLTVPSLVYFLTVAERGLGWLAPKDVWLWSDPDHPIVPLYAPAVKLLGQGWVTLGTKEWIPPWVEVTQ